MRESKNGKGERAKGKGAPNGRSLALFVRLLALPLALFPLPLSSCSGPFQILGYTTETQYTREVRTVRVPIFRNRTFVRGLEFQLTEAVIKEIEAKTPWKVVQHGQADTELVGSVIQVSKRVILPNRLNEVRAAELRLGVELVWRDLRSGQVLSTAGDPNPPSLDAFSIPDPMAPPPPARPVLVQRTAAFIPELGESITTAKKEVVDDLAEQVVSMMERPW